MITLLRPNEIPKLAGIGVDHHLVTCTDAEIYDVELNEFIGCLGIDFYTELVAGLVDYSTATNWTTGAYIAGDKVKYSGFYYVAKVNTSQEPNGSDWELGNKFTETTFEDFWCQHLGKYLALSVVRNDIAGHMVQITSQGAVRKEGEGFSPATEKEVKLLAADYDKKISRSFRLIDWYLNLNKDVFLIDGVTKAFRNYMAFGEVCETCGQCGCGGSCVTLKKARNKYASY